MFRKRDLLRSSLDDFDGKGLCKHSSIPIFPSPFLSTISITWRNGPVGCAEVSASFNCDQLFISVLVKASSQLFGPNADCIDLGRVNSTVTKSS